MLRFGPSTSETQSLLTRRIRWRLWLLVGLLGVVIGVMQSVKQPTTVAQLNSLLQSIPAQDSNQAKLELLEEEPRLTVDARPGERSEASAGKLKSSIDLSQVEDNTFFRPAENEAWFAILDGLNQQSSEPVHWEAVGEVTYAQFLAQPDVYRGKLATVRGTVLREELLDAPANDVGIKTYHRLVIRPLGGGNWPIIVYCLELPESFPRGEALKVDVVVEGIFFKNWSYAWEEGLGLAPVLLAETVGSHSDSPVVPEVSKLPETDDPQFSGATEVAKSRFRDILALIGLDPNKLSNFFITTDLTDSDWQLLSQLFARLSQYSSAELENWALPFAKVSRESVGNLLDLNGTVLECSTIVVPAEHVPLLGLSEIYQCQVQLDEAKVATLLATGVPNRWERETPISEPIACLAVLLRVEDGKYLFATNRVSWFPKAGIPSGQLLLAENGMDAALWDAVKQYGEFVSPETSREAEAFYSCLAALEMIPAAQLSERISLHLDSQAKAQLLFEDKVKRQIADAVIEQAELGLSSVVPLFLTSDRQIGELVRLEGIARRAVRIVNEVKSGEGRTGRPTDYYELELFTRDSQNLPIVCCISYLPKGFPLGDQIHELIRIEGVFFKSWSYRSRKLVEGDGQTKHQQQRYTPIVLAGTVTWIQEAPTQPGWWGLAAGIGFLTFLAAAWVKFILHWRRDRRPRMTDEQIELPNL